MAGFFALFKVDYSFCFDPFLASKELSLILSSAIFLVFIVGFI